MGKAIKSIILVLVIASLAYPAAALEEEVLQIFSEGIREAEVEMWEEAASFFSQAVELNPNFEVGHYYLGISLFHLGDLPGAEEALQRAISLKPSRMGTRLVLGQTLLEEHQPLEAVEKLEEELPLRPISQQPEAQNVLGLAYWAVEELGMATAQLTSALEQEPNLIQARFNLGHLYESREMYPKALKEYKKCKEIIEAWAEARRRAVAEMPYGRRKAEVTEEEIHEKYRFVSTFVLKEGGWPRLSKALGDLNVKMKRFVEARGHYRDALSRYQHGNPYDVDAITRIGLAYLEEAKYEISQGKAFRPARILRVAARQFEDVLDIDPSYAPAYEGLGLTYLTEAKTYGALRTGRVIRPHTAGEAIEYFEEALKIAPAYAAGRVSLGKAYLLEGRYGEAMMEFWKAEDLARQQFDYSTEEKALLGEAKAMLLLRDYIGATELTTRILEINPDKVEALMVRAEALYERGEYEAASDDLSIVLGKQPENPEAHSLYGDVLRAQLFWSAARRHYKEALTLVPESRAPEVAAKRSHLLHMLGLSYLGEKKFKEAVRFLKEALASHPSNYWAERSLAKAYVALGKYWAAQSALEIAASIAPTAADESDTYYEMGQISETLGDIHEAYRRYTQALQVDPTNINAKDALEKLQGGDELR